MGEGARMTKSEYTQLQRLIRKLSDARDIADRLELTIGNGAEVGSLVGSLVDELELRRDAVKREAA